MSQSKRSRGAQFLDLPAATTPQDVQRMTMSQQSPDIPPHVWDMLQEAGEEAARLLRDILAGPAFRAYKPSDQRSLIELALTRAYGLPVRRSLAVNLNTDDADAIAASLMGLHDALPERAVRFARGPQEARDVTPEGDAP
jgi:hypothetical protein